MEKKKKFCYNWIELNSHCNGNCNGNWLELQWTAKVCQHLRVCYRFYRQVPTHTPCNKVIPLHGHILSCYTWNINWNWNRFFEFSFFVSHQSHELVHLLLKLRHTHSLDILCPLFGPPDHDDYGISWEYQGRMTEVKRSTHTSTSIYAIF